MYSPLRANGDGLQSVYLVEVGRPFAAAQFRLIGGEANKGADVAKEVDRADQLSPSREPGTEQWEDRVKGEIRKDLNFPEAEAEAVFRPLRDAASCAYSTRNRRTYVDLVTPVLGSN
jgi:putative restriction endonuclease